jgi:hypothetical protein
MRGAGDRKSDIIAVQMSRSFRLGPFNLSFFRRSDSKLVAGLLECSQNPASVGLLGGVTTITWSNLSPGKWSFFTVSLTERAVSG